MILKKLLLFCLIKKSLGKEFNVEISVDNFISINEDTFIFKAKVQSYFITTSREVYIKENYSNLSIGDYVDYPVYYENLKTNVNWKSELVGWRILDINDETNVVKLVSAGCPMTYYVYHTGESDMNIYNFTVGLFEYKYNTLVSGWKEYGFYSDESLNTKVNNIKDIEKLFNNKYTDFYKSGTTINYINDYSNYELEVSRNIDCDVPNVRVLSLLEADEMPLSLRANGAYYWLATAYNSDLIWNKVSGGNGGPMLEDQLELDWLLL